MNMEWLSKNQYVAVIMALWLLTIIAGNMADFNGDRGLATYIFASSAACFSAAACLKANEVLNELKEKKHDFN